MIFSKIKTKLAQRAWEKHYQIPKHLQTIESLYQDFDGYIISKQARETAPSLALTYGEINLYSFLALMSLAKPNRDTVFYDLGSGLGKTVLAFQLCYQPTKSYGIEYLKPLHEIAQERRTTLGASQQIQFLNQDILESDWSDANLIFLNVASFVPDHWQDINQKLLLTPVATIITCAKPMQNATDYKIFPTRVETSWGIIPVYIHKRQIN
jgi:hypothetical protein